MMNVRVKKLAGTIGARVTGIDLNRALDGAAVRSIASALARHGVLVFPDQAVTDKAHVRFARHFGTPGVFRPPNNPQGLEPEIFRLANTDTSGRLLPPDHERLRLQRLNWTWHIDGSYRALPNVGTILHGIEVASDGGDTVFADLVAAHAALPASLKERITALSAVHDFEFQVRARGLPPMKPEERSRLAPVEHPLVRRHPDGRHSLFLSPPYTARLVGCGEAEGRALMAELMDWATRDQFLYRHVWRPHDLLMWDNSWTMHRVTPFDMARRKRVMHGVTLVAAGSGDFVETAGGFQSLGDGVA